MKDLTRQLQTQANQHSREVENKQRRGVEDKQAAIRIHEAAVSLGGTQTHLIIYTLATGVSLIPLSLLALMWSMECR